MGAGHKQKFRSYTKYKTVGLGGPTVKTPRFHCREHEFDPWSKIPYAVQFHKKKKKRLRVFVYVCVEGVRS